MVSVDDLFKCVLVRAEEVAAVDKDAAGRLLKYGCKLLKAYEIHQELRSFDDLPFILDEDTLKYMVVVGPRMSYFFNPVKTEEGAIYWNGIFHHARMQKIAKGHIAQKKPMFADLFAPI